MKKNIGIDVPQPKEQKDLLADKHSPFTGSIRVRGRMFTGTVLSTKMARTATVSWSRMQYVPKYERYIRKWTKVHAHNPDLLNAQKGDIVRIVETRPISKTKNFVIVEILGKDIEAQIKEESMELDKRQKQERAQQKQERKETQKALKEKAKGSSPRPAPVRAPVKKDEEDDAEDVAEEEPEAEASESDTEETQ